MLVASQQKFRLSVLKLGSFIPLVTTFVTTLVLLAANPAQAQIQFQNATGSHLKGGIHSESWGVTVGDFNGDHWPDVFTNNHRNRSSLYRNNGDGVLIDELLTIDRSRVLLPNYVDQHGAAFADINGDGSDDLIAGTNAQSLHRLLISSNGVLNDQTLTRLGSDLNTAYSMWFDFDRDGLTDLFQGRRYSAGSTSAYWSQTPNGVFTGPNTVPGCTGDWGFLIDVTKDQVSDYICAVDGYFPRRAHDFSSGNFIDITNQLPFVGNVLDIAAADLNNDLLTDLVFTRGSIMQSGAVLHGTNRIEASSVTNQNVVQFEFTTSGTITVSAYSETETRLNRQITDDASFAGFDFDFNVSANRWLVSRTSTEWDTGYVVIDSNQPITNLENINTRSRDRPINPIVYRQTNTGWQNTSGLSGLEQIGIQCASVVAADFDNDMDRDLYFTCTQGANNLPNRLFENDGQGSFTEIPNAGGALGVTGAPIQDRVGTSDSAGVADFNNDGFLDIFVVNGLNTIPVRHRFGPHELMLNSGNSNHWIQLNLNGTSSDPDATGARVLATAGGQTQLLETGAIYHRWAQSHNRVHFGLATNTSVDITIQWPSGITETFNDIAADKLYDVTEGGSITPINVLPVSGYAAPVTGDECGAPSFQTVLDRAVFVYRNCSTGRWSLRMSAGLAQTDISGSLETTSNVSVSNTVLLENNDFVNTSDPQNIEFSMTAASGQLDGFDFDVSDTAENCLSITAQNGTELPRILIGPKHLPVTAPIDLNGYGNCDHIEPPITPELTISDASVDEGSAFGTVIVSLSPANTTSTVRVTAAAQRLSATPGQDHYGFSRILEFAPGETSKTINVTILDDTIVESDELVGIRLYNASNADIVDDTATLTIIDNDNGTTPTLTVNDVSVDEDSGVGTFTVTLSPANDNAIVEVDAAAQIVTATPGQDYYGFTKPLTFAVGETQKSVNVTILDDTEIENNESLGVRLIRPTNSQIGDGFGEMTIIDDDTNSSEPTISVNDINVNEDAGAGTFSVTLSAANPNATVTVNVAAKTLTATPGSDYYGFSLTLRFLPGQVAKTISVTVLDDNLDEPTETMGIRLYNATNAAIADDEGAMQIFDND